MTKSEYYKNYKMIINSTYGKFGGYDVNKDFIFRFNIDEELFDEFITSTKLLINYYNILNGLVVTNQGEYKLNEFLSMIKVYDRKRKILKLMINSHTISMV